MTLTAFPQPGVTPANWGAQLNAAIKDRLVVVRVEEYGVEGDLIADDTAALNDAAAAAAGGVLIGKKDAVYRVTGTVTFPPNTTWIANGSTFRKEFVSANPAVRTADGFNGDLLSVTCVGSGDTTGIDRALHLQGSNLRIGKVVATSLTANQNGGGNMGVTIGGAAAGSWYDDVQIGSVSVTNWQNALMIKGLRGSQVDNIEVTNYVTGVYVFHCQRSTFHRAYVRGTSSVANGTAGQNGLLLEITAANSYAAYDIADVRFVDWIVEGAPEHSYRIGGDRAVRGVHFVRCVSRKAGNAAGNVATGGSGFKALGVSGNHHRDLRYIDCVVEDSNPAGNGINNFAAWHMAHVDGLTITNPRTTVKDNTECGRHGILLFSVSGVSIVNPDVVNVQRKGLYVMKDSLDPAPMDVTDVQVIGGRFGSTTDYAVQMDPQNVTFRDIALKDVTLVGNTTQVVAVRQEAVTSGGAYTNVYLGVNYRLVGSAGTTPPLFTQAGTFIDYRGPLFGSFGITAENGSTHQDTTNGLFKIRKAGAWTTL